MQRGFKVTKILMDGQSNWIRGNLAELKINLNIWSNDKHVGEKKNLTEQLKKGSEESTTLYPSRKCPEEWSYILSLSLSSLWTLFHHQHRWGGTSARARKSQAWPLIKTRIVTYNLGSIQKCMRPTIIRCSNRPQGTSPWGQPATPKGHTYLWVSPPGEEWTKKASLLSSFRKTQPILCIALYNVTNGAYTSKTDTSGRS